MPRAKRSTRRHPKKNPHGIVSVSRGGYGFVETPEGEYFVPASKMNGAMPGDEVEIIPVSVNRDRPQPGKLHNEVGQKPTARIINIIKRANTFVIGRFEVCDPFGVVVPEDPRYGYDIFTNLKDNKIAKDGDTVRVRITQFPTRREAAFGVIEEVIVGTSPSDLEIQKLIASSNFHESFAPEVEAEADMCQVDLEKAFREGYADIRDRFVITVDPHDAKDYDDALSLQEVTGGWILGVHIADVSYYVKDRSLIDFEARQRGTSVYLVDRVIPMLPEHLCNDVCSLKQDEPRRTFTVDIHLDYRGNVVDSEIYLAVIQSKARLSYGIAQELLDRGDRDSQTGKLLHGLREISKLLESNRHNAGSLDLESREAHVILDEQKCPVRVEIRQKTEATSLVEQAMILANSVVANYLHSRELPCVYRVHDLPSSDGLQEIVPVLEEFEFTEGIDMDGFVAGNPKVIQEVLDAAKGGQAGELVSMLVLRSLKRAVYSPKHRAHYALALDDYCHFTSPIRRYPDLMVHRILRQAVAGRIPKETEKFLTSIADHSSAMEREAEKASQKSQDIKLAEYMTRYIGERFSGTIVGVTSYGIYVELENTAVGLAIPSETYNEPFAYNVDRQMLIGQDSGRLFRLGQHVVVRLDRTSLREGTLDFTVIS